MESILSSCKAHPWWILTVSISAIIIASCLCWVLSFTKQDAAAWVQAIGSIAAIVGAFSIANLQHKNEMRDRKQEKVDQRVSVAHQIKHLIAFANWPHVPSPTSFSPEQKLDLAKKLEVDAQERNLRIFESFPIFEVKDPMPITQMTRMSNNWYEGIRRMKRARDLALAGDSAWESAFDDLISFPPQSDQVGKNLDGYVTLVATGKYRGYEILDKICL